MELDSWRPCVFEAGIRRAGVLVAGGGAEPCSMEAARDAEPCVWVAGCKAEPCTLEEDDTDTYVSEAGDVEP